jgi:phosphate transport system protein
MPERHILQAFESALSVIHADLQRMASVTLKNLENAVEGLIKRKLDSCNAVIADDDEVDQLEKRVDQDAVQIMVKYSPQARDLRRVLTCMRVSQQLERISDEAVNIAKRARKLDTTVELPEMDLLQSIADTATAMARDALEAFQERDVTKALLLGSRDKALDKEHKEFIRRMIKRTEQDVPHINNYVDLMFIVRFMERIGDHCVNIGEDLVYSETAYDIRHGGTHPETPPAA